MAFREYAMVVSISHALFVLFSIAATRAKPLVHAIQFKASDNVRRLRMIGCITRQATRGHTVLLCTYIGWCYPRREPCDASVEGSHVRRRRQTPVRARRPVL